MSFSRRSFARLAGLAAGGYMAGLRPFGEMAAQAESMAGSQSGAADYRALVCVCLSGGNDSNNTVVPVSSSEYAAYVSARGPLALAPSSLNQLSGVPFALHAAMPGIAAMFNAKQAAVLANVGTLVQPLTPAQYRAGTGIAPDLLFSHPDQESLWENATTGSAGTFGWGGRIADLQGPTGAGGDLPMVVSMAGSAVFASGQSSMPLVINPGVTPLPACTDAPLYCSARATATQQMLQMKSGLVVVQADRTVEGDALGYAVTLAAALQDAPALPAALTVDSFAQQLGQVAQMIALRGSFGARRQIFFVRLQGFDTHSVQLATHASQLSSIDNGLAAFHSFIAQLGAASQVTSFTVSEFSRTLLANGSAGSDHAWGGHQFILGGAVAGGQVYGTFPSLVLNGADDVDGTGRFVPSTAAAQYAATLATWFGVPVASLPTILPVLPNFTSTNLGFLA